MSRMEDRRRVALSDLHTTIFGDAAAASIAQKTALIKAMINSPAAMYDAGLRTALPDGIKSYGGSCVHRLLAPGERVVSAPSSGVRRCKSQMSHCLRRLMLAASSTSTASTCTGAAPCTSTATTRVPLTRLCKSTSSRRTFVGTARWMTTARSSFPTTSRSPYSRSYQLLGCQPPKANWTRSSTSSSLAQIALQPRS